MPVSREDRVGRQNWKKGKENRGGSHKYEACEGSFIIPFHVKHEWRGDVGVLHGECRICGKWCQLRPDSSLMPRHKALSRIVRAQRDET